MNSKLALSDETLLRIEKPERYIGNEVNSVTKDKSQIDVRFAFCFPDVYEIGMSNLGMMILYDMMNAREDTWCERLFSPWTDLDRIMREKQIPLFALESQDPVKDFDFLGFTHINGKSHWGKYCVVHRTSKKKLIQKRQNAKKWLREQMHKSIRETIETLNKKLEGHYRYYGIYGNWISLNKFYRYVKWELFRTKRRRDQTCWLTWAKFREILRIYPIVYPKVYLKSAY
jgi:hypothetical protein